MCLNNEISHHICTCTVKMQTRKCGLIRSIDMDAFATSTACCNLELQNLITVIKSSVGASGYSM